ncbi:hypothetical protein A6456_10820 [Paraburkholderia tropica]|nr:hypothetical protein A6456_10820 [Paraburkholderia tropica]
MSGGHRFVGCCDELGSGDAVDGIAEAPQGSDAVGFCSLEARSIKSCQARQSLLFGAELSHSSGKPMSQRLCAGLNWPPLLIAAQDPISSSPETVSRAGSVLFAIAPRLCNVCRALRPSPRFALMFGASGLQFGVGQLASAAIAARSGPFERIASMIAPCVDRTPLSASADVGVGQPASAAA